MVIFIILSAGLSFTICRNSAPAETSVRNVKVNTVSDGFSQILSASAAIKLGLALKHQIDSLSQIKTLSKKDSETLVNDLDKLQQLNKPLHP